MQGLVLIAGIVMISHAARTTLRTIADFNSGVGYASVSWNNSPTLAAIRRLPVVGDIYTNAPDLVGYAVRRRAYFVPQRVPPRTNVPDPINPYERQVATLRATLRKAGYVVFFDRVDWRPYLGEEAELVEGLNLQLITAAADGRIYVSKHSRTGGTP